jgi:hypothetical protein
LWERARVRGSNGFHPLLASPIKGEEGISATATHRTSRRLAMGDEARKRLTETVHGAG